jgi:Ca2+-binding RTX toxin-like protein
MIIDVKGTRSGGGAKTISRQTYLLRDIQLSKLPWALAAFLFGVAAYLKSALPGAAEQAPEEAPPQPEPEAPRLKLVAQDPEAPPTEAVAVPEEEKSEAAGSSGFVAVRLPSAEFMLIDSPPIRFPMPDSREADISELASFRDALVSANDNGPAGSRAGGGNTSSPPAPPQERSRRLPPVKDDEESADPDKPPTKPPLTSGNPSDDLDNDEEETRNREPRTSGPVRLYDVYGCAAVVIALTDLLASTSDPDGDALTIRNMSVSSGTIVRDGSNWLFDPGGVGPVTVSYEISDGKVSVIQHATFSVFENPPMIGTTGNDVLVGSACGDRVEGLVGDDSIDGRAGDDVVEGGAGDDHIVGGVGNDILAGGEGNDIILGGAGNDQISGGNGDDRLFGDNGDDTVFADAGDDQIDGGEGNDLLFGGDGNDRVAGGGGADRIQGDDGDDVLAGGDGDDIVFGNSGNDLVDGGTGADILSDGAGEDTVLAGAGNDHLVVTLDAQADVFNGGEGRDTLVLAATEEGVAVDLVAGTAAGEEIGTNQVFGIEVVEAGSGNDSLIGASADEKFVGGAGSDMLSGHIGNDSLSGGEGHDSIAGGDGDDSIEGGAGDDRLSDGAGEDTALGGAGDDVVVAAADRSDDTYDGGTGEDVLDYSVTKRGIVVDMTTGKVTGDEIGNDSIGRFEGVIGGSGNDRVMAGDRSLVITGGEGDDVFEFATPLNANTTVTVFHAITDFESGDLIKMSKYDIFDEVADEIEDRFEAIYGEHVDIDEGRLRYRHERTEHADRTVIEADLDRDRIYETTIYLDGHHAIVIVENA